MPTRFVILHHRLEDSEHWDFMLEYGDSLLTWQLPRDPTGPGSFPMPANRIADHRKAYLSYEGPVAGNRGTVRQMDAGTTQIGCLTESRCEFEITGRQLAGKFSLSQVCGADWTFIRA